MMSLKKMVATKRQKISMNMKIISDIANLYGRSASTICIILKNKIEILKKKLDLVKRAQLPSIAQKALDVEAVCVDEWEAATR